MIVGLGIDLIELIRVRGAVEHFGDRFLRRVYTDEEIAYCRGKADPVPSLAGRFAVKEAAMKALGTGYARGVWFRSIEVARKPAEAPGVVFHGGARTRADDMGVTNIFVSLTHEKGMAAAVVVLEGER